MNEEQSVKFGIDEMKKLNQKMKQILTPLYEIFDDDFKQTFRQFAQSTSCLGLECLTEEDILMSLLKNIRMQIENESDVRRLIYDVAEIRVKINEISNEKQKIDQLLKENTENKDIILDEIRFKMDDKNFFVKKHRQYVDNVNDLENNLSRNRGFVDDVRLENVNENKKRVQELQKVFDVLNKRLSTYRNLPADENLAKVKVEEKRVELDMLERQLNDMLENIQLQNQNDTQNLQGTQRLSMEKQILNKEH